MKKKYLREKEIGGLENVINKNLENRFYIFAIKNKNK